MSSAAQESFWPTPKGVGGCRSPSPVKSTMPDDYEAMRTGARVHGHQHLDASHPPACYRVATDGYRADALKSANNVVHRDDVCRFCCDDGGSGLVVAGDQQVHDAHCRWLRLMVATGSRHEPGRSCPGLGGGCRDHLVAADPRGAATATTPRSIRLALSRSGTTQAEPAGFHTLSTVPTSSPTGGHAVGPLGDPAHMSTPVVGALTELDALLAARLVTDAGLSVLPFDLFALEAVVVIVVDRAMLRRGLLRVRVVRGHLAVARRRSYWARSTRRMRRERRRSRRHESHASGCEKGSRHSSDGFGFSSEDGGAVCSGGAAAREAASGGFASSSADRSSCCSAGFASSSTRTPFRKFA